MEQRKSFVFNLAWADVLSGFPAEVRLEVYDAIIRYAQSGTLSELKPLANMAFLFIKNELDAENDKLSDLSNVRSEAGKQGGRGNKSKKANALFAFDEKAKKAKKANAFDADFDENSEIPLVPIAESSTTEPNIEPTTDVDSLSSTLNINNKKRDNKEKPTKERNEKKTELTWCQQVFGEQYQLFIGEAFSWNRTETVCLNSVVGKLTQKMEEQNFDTSDEARHAALQSFLSVLWKNGDNFIRSNFVPHVIDLKFNEFYIVAKNGKPRQQKGNAGISDEYIAKVARELAGL